MPPLLSCPTNFLPVTPLIFLIFLTSLIYQAQTRLYAKRFVLSIVIFFYFIKKLFLFRRLFQALFRRRYSFKLGRLEDITVH